MSEMTEDRVHITSYPVGVGSMRKKKKMRRDYVIRVVHDGEDEIKKSQIKLIGQDEWFEREELRSIRLYFSQFVFGYENIDPKDAVKKERRRYKFVKILNY